MAVFAGPAKWWGESGINDAARIFASTGLVVQSGLVLNLDAGASTSYPGSGTTWTDLSGNGNNGTLANGPTFSSANGGSILFDGTNDYLSVTISCNRNYYSIDWWTRPTAVSNYDQMILMNSTGTAGSYWQGFTAHTNSSGTLNIGTNLSNYFAITGSPLVNGVWHNFTWTFNNGDAIVYKNGVQIQQGTKSAHSADYTLLQIGAGPSFGEGTLFDGNCASLKLYSNKVLTASEVSQNFNALRARFGI